MNSIFSLLGKIIGFLIRPLVILAILFTTRSKVLVVQGKKVLVVKGWLDINNKWSLPGGGVKGDELPLPGALRELKEETGLRLKPSNLKPLGLQQQKKGLRFKYHAFFASIDSELPLKPRGLEIKKAQFVPIDKLNLNNAEAHVLDLINLKLMESKE